MRDIRRRYYDLFSHIYDLIIRLHSLDKQGSLRRYLVEKADTENDDRVLDICTGTGSVVAEFSNRLTGEGMAVGVDFSRGMLKKAKKKATRLRLTKICLVEGSAADLPFKGECFDVITCSHAFYELKGKEREKAIEEMARIAKKGGKLLIMEHEVPNNPLVKLLFYLRIYVMGSKDARIFLKDELAPFRGSFEGDLRPGTKKKKLYDTGQTFRGIFSHELLYFGG